jgi:hypothetical protein
MPWKNSDLEYNDQEHCYFYQGQRIPGFHDIAHRFRLTDTTWDIAQEYLIRGKAIHEGIRLINNKQLDWSTVHEDIKNHLAAYQNFVKMNGWKSVKSEAIAYHPKFMYACRLDDYGFFEGSQKPSIIEYKTTTIPKWAGIQTAAQEIAVDGDLCDRWAVALKADGTYSLRQFIDPVDHYIWMSMVAIFNWQKNNGYQVFK